MVNSCVAFGCNYEYNPIEKKALHSFPFKRPEILELWVKAIRRQNWNPSRTSRLCGSHFLANDYVVKPGITTKLLKPNAVPSVFSFPKQLLKKNTPCSTPTIGLSKQKIQNDMENYIQYHVMGSVSQIRKNSGCAPSKCECQIDRRKPTSNTTVHKKHRKLLIEECERDIERRAFMGKVGAESTISTRFQESESTSSGSPELVVKEENQFSLNEIEDDKGLIQQFTKSDDIMVGNIEEFSNQTDGAFEMEETKIVNREQLENDVKVEIIERQFEDLKNDVQEMETSRSEDQVNISKIENIFKVEIFENDFVDIKEEVKEIGSSRSEDQYKEEVKLEVDDHCVFNNDVSFEQQSSSDCNGIEANVDEHYDYINVHFNHIESEHNDYGKNSKKFQCKHCEFSTAYENNLTLHISSKHTNVKCKCKFCNYKAGNKHVLKRHLKLQHGDAGANVKTFECEQCDYLTFYSCLIKRHIKTAHMNKRRHKCNYCISKFKVKSSLISHLKSRHNDSGTNRPTLSCEFCDFNSVYRKCVKNHMLRVHKNGKDV